MMVTVMRGSLLVADENGNKYVENPQNCVHFEFCWLVNVF